MTINSFIIANNLPIPTPTAPLNITEYIQPLEFTWTEVNIDNFSYDFALYEDSSDEILFSVYGLQTNNFILKEEDFELVNDKKYNWKIRSVYYTCAGDWSSFANFDKKAIEMAIPISPNNLGCLTSNDITFNWSTGVGIEYYIFEISTDSLFNNIIDSKNTTEINYKMTTLIDGEYFWRIKSYDKYSKEYISDYVKLTIHPTSSSNPNPSSLIPDTSNVDSMPVNFSWNGNVLTDPENYEIQISNDNFTTILYSTNDIYDTSFQLDSNTLNLTDGNYQWRVRINYQECFLSDWSTPASFTRICYDWTQQNFTVNTIEKDCRSIEMTIIPSTFTDLDKYIVELSGANTRTIDPASTTNIIDNLNIGLTNYTVRAVSSIGCSDLIRTGSFTVHWEWDYVAGNTGNDMSYDSVVDKDGNILITGYFSGTVNFGGGDRTSVGNLDIFVLKLDNAGNYLWDYTAGSTNEDKGLSIDVDSNGNSYITGYYKGLINFGSTGKSCSGQADIFTLKLDSDGNYLWDRVARSTGYNEGKDIVVDSDGNCYVVGYYHNTINFGGSNRSNINTFADFFIFKLDSNGGFQWDYVNGGIGTEEAWAIDIDDENSIYIGGVFSNTVNFGNGNRTPSPNTQRDIFVLKLASNKAFKWVYTKGSSNNDWLYDIVVDDFRNSYIVGLYANTINFGGGNRSVQGSSNLFAVKINMNGNYMWDYCKGSSGADLAFSITKDKNNDILFMNRYSGTIDFGGGNRTSNGNHDLCIVKMDSDKNYICDYSIGGTNSECSEGGIYTDDYNSVYVSGFFQSSSIDIGGGTRTNVNPSNVDIFVLKFNF